MAKLKKWVDKYGWIIIAALLIAFISVFALLHERGRRREMNKNG